MKFDINSVITGKVKFTADIDCEESESDAVKKGLAAKWAIENNINLSRTNLSGANLAGVDLRSVDLINANLSNADLAGANLSNVDLSNVNLSNADLEGANLSGVDSSNANLSRANLRSGNLSCLNLSSADLTGANLSLTNLRCVNLRGANLSDTSFNYAFGGISPYIKFISIDRYQIIYTNKSIFIGCETYKIEEWRKFDDESIERLDGEYTLEFWKKYKSFIFKAIELAPAIATK